ncbi:MAG: nucleotide exchange factor GrpE [Prevotella sp.]|nr:nucleotide exchange factor GrpE [Prevotella sp.]
MDKIRKLKDMKPEDIKDTENNEQTNAAQEDNTDNESQETTGDTTQTASEEASTDENKASESTETSDENNDKDPLDIALTEISELKTKMLYMQAEFDNYRKRAMKEKADLILSGGEKTITAVLPVIDDFERALADKSDNPEAIREGMQLIYQKFIKTLEGLGVKKIKTEGADFNVDYHEAVAQVPGMGEDKSGKVIDCIQTGYTLNDKVIRFAKVAVGV